MLRGMGHDDETGRLLLLQMLLKSDHVPKASMQIRSTHVLKASKPRYRVWRPSIQERMAFDVRLKALKV